MTEAADTGIETTPETPPNGATDTPSDGGPSVADLLRQFEAFKKKANGELAKLRRTTARDAAPPEPEATPTTGSAGVTEDDIRAYMALGASESAIPEAVMNDFGEEYNALPVQQRALMAKMAAAIARAAGPESRGAMPATPTARNTKSATRSSVPYPTTQQELAKLARENPKAYAALKADPGFDASELDTL